MPPSFWFANSGSVSVANVEPPSRETSTCPWLPPTLPNEPQRPVAAATTCGLPASSAIAPIDSETCWSVSGVHDGVAASALVVRQTPPLTDATYMMLALVGCVTTASTAPATGLRALAGCSVACPLRMGAGPCVTQVAPTRGDSTTEMSGNASSPQPATVIALTMVVVAKIKRP